VKVAESVAVGAAAGSRVNHPGVSQDDKAVSEHKGAETPCPDRHDLATRGIRPMNILPRDRQMAVIAALSEGTSISTVERLTGHPRLSSLGHYPPSAA